MEANRIYLNGKLLIDLTQDTVTEDHHVVDGKTFHKPDGTIDTGTARLGRPIEVSTSEEMDEILANATEKDVGTYYLYTGETTDTYENNALYIVEEE